MAEATRLIQDVSAPPRVKAVPLLDPPRSAEFEWLRGHAREYVGQWVALDGSRLLAAALHLKDLLRHLSPAERARNPLFHRVDLD